MPMRLILLFLSATLAAFPQVLSVGVKGGVPLTDAFQANLTGNKNYFFNTKRYTVGPTVELHLPFRLGVEVDALYKRLDYNSTGGATFPNEILSSRTTANSWEFPVLLKYRLFSGPVRPYLAGGAAFNYLSNLSQTTDLLVTVAPVHTITTSSRPSELANRFRPGVVMGGGVEVKALFLRVSPEVRYTHWGWPSFRELCCGASFRSNDNQAEFLLGISF